MCERCRSADDFLINHEPPDGLHPKWKLRRQRALGWQAMMKGPGMTGEEVETARKGYEADFELRRMAREEIAVRRLRARLARVRKG